MIKPGPTIQAFASLTNCTVDEVIEWITEYVKRPPEHAEAEESERLASIKAYVTWRLGEAARR